MREILLSFDPVGVVLLLASLLCYLLALQWAGIRLAWDLATVIGLLVGWIVLAGLFLDNEWYQGDKALMALRML